MKSLIRVSILLFALTMTLGVSTGFAQEDDAKLNVNTATEEQLAAIPEVGPELAAKIIQYRSEMGDIFALDDTAYALLPARKRVS